MVDYPRPVVAAIDRGKSLRRDPIDSLEFVAKMGFASETEFTCYRLIRPAFRYELAGEPALQLFGPGPRGLVKPSGEESLQLSQRNGAKRGDGRGLELGLPGQLFPVRYP